MLIYSQGQRQWHVAVCITIRRVHKHTENTPNIELSWQKHPDIHVFIPMPSSAGSQERNERLEWLSEDNYNLIEYADRPDSDKERSRNRQAFYSIDYFRSEIRPVTRLRPYQGKKVVVIMTQVETMRKETANSFLKLLEEPSEGIVFILTTHHYEQLLPTITLPLSAYCIRRKHFN